MAGLKGMVYLTGMTKNHQVVNLMEVWSRCSLCGRSGFTAALVSTPCPAKLELDDWYEDIAPDNGAELGDPG